MIDINITLFIQMANVLVLVFLMNLVLYRPIRKLVAQRNQFMADKQNVIDRADKESAEALREFEGTIQTARVKGRQKVQEMKELAYQQEKDLLQKSAEESAKQLAGIRKTIKTEIGRARKQLRAQIQAFSLDLAQKILGRSI
jgi:F-type H+-transporting ATPase subunit b